MALPHCYCDPTQRRCCCLSSSGMSNATRLSGETQPNRLNTLDAALLELGMLSVAISEQPHNRRLRSYSFTTAHDSSSVLSHRDTLTPPTLNFHDPLTLDTDSKDLATGSSSVTVQPPNSPVSPSAWLHAQNKSLLFPPNHPIPPKFDGDESSLHPAATSRNSFREPELDFSDSLDRESHLQVLSSLPNSSSPLVMRPRRMRMNSGPCGSTSRSNSSNSHKSALVWPYKIPRPRLKREMERVRTRSETLFEVDESNLDGSANAFGASGAAASDKENVLSLNSAFDAMTVLPPATALETKSAAEAHFARSKSLEELTLAGANSAGLHAVVDSVSHRIENLHVA